MNRMSPRLPDAIHANEMRALNGTYEDDVYERNPYIVYSTHIAYSR